jgi:hypothetical protein
MKDQIDAEIARRQAEIEALETRRAAMRARRRADDLDREAAEVLHREGLGDLAIRTPDTFIDAQARTFGRVLHTETEIVGNVMRQMGGLRAPAMEPAKPPTAIMAPSRVIIAGADRNKPEPDMPLDTPVVTNDDMGRELRGSITALDVARARRVRGTTAQACAVARIRYQARAAREGRKS